MATLPENLSVAMPPALLRLVQLPTLFWGLAMPPAQLRLVPLPTLFWGCRSATPNAAKRPEVTPPVALCHREG